MSPNNISSLPAASTNRRGSSQGSNVSLTDVLEMLKSNGAKPMLFAVLAAKADGIPPGHSPHVSNRDRSGVQRLPEVPRMPMGGHF